MAGGVSLRRDGAVARIALDRRESLNALSRADWRGLAEAAAAVRADAGIGCVVVCGAGGRAFSAGLDMSRFAEERRTPAAARAYSEDTARATARLAALPMPTIAMIEGYCMGSGVDVACHCDLRFAAADAVFRVAPGSVGLFLDRSFVAGLVGVVGRARALEMVLEGRRYDARAALGIGLVTRVAPAGALARETMRRAAGLAEAHAAMSAKRSTSTSP